MVVEVPTGVDLFSTPRKMGILSVLLRAATGEVLGHGGHRVMAERLTLEAPNVGHGEPTREVGVLAERVADSRPAWFRGQIDLGMEGHPDSPAVYSCLAVSANP